MNARCAIAWVRRGVLKQDHASVDRKRVMARTRIFTLCAEVDESEMLKECERDVDVVSRPARSWDSSRMGLTTSGHANILAARLAHHFPTVAFEEQKKTTEQEFELWNNFIETPRGLFEASGALGTVLAISFSDLLRGLKVV